MGLRAVPGGVSVGEVLEIKDKEHFRSLLSQAHANRQVMVVDFLTTWCGPCKLIAPEVEKMAAQYATQGPHVCVAKVTCDSSDDNKNWAMKIKIRSLPTFRVYCNGSEDHVAEMMGTKIADLRKIVDEQVAAIHQ